MGSAARERDAGDDPATAGALTLAASTVLLLLVALIAAAGFVVIAQRRLRQLGMLAAVGATERRLRLVLLADGAVIGVVAALVGTALGLAGWIVAAPGSRASPVAGSMPHRCRGGWSWRAWRSRW